MLQLPSPLSPPFAIRFSAAFLSEEPANPENSTLDPQSQYVSESHFHNPSQPATHHHPPASVLYMCVYPDFVRPSLCVLLAV